MEKKSAEETLKVVIDRIVVSLEELGEVGDSEKEQFQYGEKTAYVECLEWIQLWISADENGLDFEIEKRFPL